MMIQYGLAAGALSFALVSVRLVASGWWPPGFFGVLSSLVELDIDCQQARGLLLLVGWSWCLMGSPMSFSLAQDEGLATLF